jgi:hypothetical protein
MNIGGSFDPGQPTRSLYHFKLAIALGMGAKGAPLSSAGTNRFL